MAFHREFTPGTMSPQSAPGLAEPRPLASYLNELGVIRRADGERRGNDLLGQSTISRFHGQWHRLRVARDTTGALNGALRTAVKTARQGRIYASMFKQVSVPGRQSR